MPSISRYILIPRSMLEHLNTLSLEDKNGKGLEYNKRNGSNVCSTSKTRKTIDESIHKEMIENMITGATTTT